MSEENLVDRIFKAVTAQGNGLYALEGLVGRIKEAVNAQANGLRHAQQRIAQLEAVVQQLAGSRMTVQPRQMQAGRPQMRMVNPVPSNVRTLPARFAQQDDPTADGDFDFEDEDIEESEVG